MRRIVLVVYSHSYWPLRVSVADHIFALRDYSENGIYYWNAISGNIPQYLRSIRFDAVIFHTSLLSRRWDRATFERFHPLAGVLSQISSIRIALPQDEFINTQLLEDWLLAADTDVVCSVLKPTEWIKVYPRLIDKGVQFHQVLTGYLSDRFVAMAADACRRHPSRDIDIGYRAWSAAPWLGRHGRLKVEIADRIKALFRSSDVVMDISTDNRDSISGSDWIGFLARCRYVLGVEGGASIHDRDGSVRSSTDAFVNGHPLASFEEIEAACFAGRDGELDCRALSPRHLEACATRTAQLLVEGDYNGILKPGLHYIEIRSDFSNLHDVLKILSDESRRCSIAERAYLDVVGSGVGSYRNFTRLIDGLISERSSFARSFEELKIKLTVLRCHTKLVELRLMIVWFAIGNVIGIGKRLGYDIDSNDVISTARAAFRLGR